jgi:hypothetical protein
MKKFNKGKHKENKKEQGMAMILTMMSLMLCTSLGIAVLFNSTGEAALSGGFMRNEQAFYAADAGIGLARESIRKELNKRIQTLGSGATLTYGTRTVQDSGTPYVLATVDSSQLTNVLSNSTLLGVNGGPSTTAATEVVRRIPALTNAGFNVVINVEFISSSNSGIVDLQQVGLNAFNVKTVLDYSTRVASATGIYRYTITSTGNNSVASGLANRSEASAVEVGMISATLEATINKGSADIPGTQSFSEFGTFYDKFPSSIVLASGIFQGKVHSNEALRFDSGNSVTFQGALTQSPLNYIHNNGSFAVSSVGASTNPKTGITVNSGFTTTPVKPVPTNAFSQELTVLNSTGKTDATFTTAQPSTANLTTVLRSAANTAPTVSGGVIADGVYLPTSGGTAINGGGIYVKGNVSELKLSISGESQVYAITQASGTTTITITPPTSISVGQTIISNGVTAPLVLLGVPIDKSSSVLSEYKPGVSLFVNGSITNMHGPAAVSGVVPPSISKNTSLSITSTSDIQLTGSVTYQEAALTATGTPQTYADGHTPKNVLGLFTNAGKIVWTPNSLYTENGNKSMTVDAAMAIFNSSTSTDTGGWTTDCSTCTSASKMTLRGSRSVSRIIPILSGGQTTNRFFDPRFANSVVTPPFFPSTSTGVTIPGTGRSVTFGTTNVQTIANTWQRTYS